MTSEFEMSDLGIQSYYQGIEVEQKTDYFSIKQIVYAKKVLDQFGMSDCNATKFPMDPNAKLDVDEQGEMIDATRYKRMIGCLRYLLHFRPDLSFSIGVASRFMEKTYCPAFQCSKTDHEVSEGNTELWFGVYSREEARSVSGIH